MIDRVSALIAVSTIRAYEQGELGSDETIVLFQFLIDSGIAWKLQGSYGRMAMAMIEAGHCTLPLSTPTPTIPTSRTEGTSPISTEVVTDRGEAG